MFQPATVLVSLILWSLPSSAASSGDTKLREYHNVNSRVASWFSPSKAPQIKKMMESISSKEDRRQFEKSYLSIKGKKLTILPFMDRLVIQEGNKKTVMQLLSLKPLRVKVNESAVFKIDSKNIYKSIDAVINAKKSASVWTYLFPSANAFLFGGGESEWLFMYSIVAESVAKDLNYNAKLAVDDSAFSDELDKFLKKYDVQSFNCNSKNKATVNKRALRGTFFSDSKGNKFYAGCGGSASSCGVLPTDKTGSVDNLDNLLQTQQLKLREATKKEAQKIANNPDFNARDFEVRCEMVWNAVMTSKYPACYYDQVNMRNTTYSEEALEALKSTNLLPDDAYNDAGIVESAKQMIDILSAVDKAELTTDQGFVLSAITACCKDMGCARKAGEKGLKMDSSVPAIEQ